PNSLCREDKGSEALRHLRLAAPAAFAAHHDQPDRIRHRARGCRYIIATLHQRAAHRRHGPAVSNSEDVLGREAKEDLTDRFVVQYPSLALLRDRVDVS